MRKAQNNASRNRNRLFPVLIIVSCGLSALALENSPGLAQNETPPEGAKKQKLDIPPEARPFYRIRILIREEKYEEALAEADRLEASLPARQAQLAALLAVYAELFSGRIDESIKRLDQNIERYADIVNPFFFQLKRRLAGISSLPKERQQLVVDAERVRSGLTVKNDPFETLSKAINPTTMSDAPQNPAQQLLQELSQQNLLKELMPDVTWQRMAVRANKAAINDTANDSCLELCKNMDDILGNTEGFLVRLDTVEELLSRVESVNQVERSQYLELCKKLLDVAPPTSELEVMRNYLLVKVDYTDIFSRMKTNPPILSSPLARATTDRLQQLANDPATPAEIRHGALFRIIWLSRLNVPIPETEEITLKYANDFPQSKFLPELYLDMAVIAGNYGWPKVTANWLDELKTRFPESPETAQVPELRARYNLDALPSKTNRSLTFYPLLWGNVIVLALVFVVFLSRRLRAG